MKRFRVPILLAVVSVLAAGLLLWTRRTASVEAATPAECLDAYYDSLQSGDVEKYLRCLGEPYRTRQGRDSFAAAGRDAKELKNLVQLAGPAEGDSSRWVDVDEVRAAGVRRVRYHLRKDERGWLIVGVDPPRERAAPLRYGTHVGEEP
jgi:hypothetical protein